MTTVIRPETATPTTVVGQAIPRRDGLVKATGTALYSFDRTLPDMAFGAIVSATIPHGRVARVDHSRALALPGVLLVLSCENQEPTPPRKEGGKPYVWFDREIVYDGQDVAFVVATTQAIADEAATLVDVVYAPLPHVATLRDALAGDAPQAGETPNVEDPGDIYGDPADYTRGDLDAGFTAAATVVTTDYDLLPETHNPFEPMVTLAAWQGDEVTVYDSVQYVMGARRSLADALGVEVERVHVIAEHVGGGFGSKLGIKSQAPLAALAAKIRGRPVRARLTRAQMNRNARHRPETLHRMRLGADAEGHLTAIDHEVWSGGAARGTYFETAAMATRFLYACPNVRSRHWRVRVNQNPPGAMRAPGEFQSQFALESALDELAAALGMDPIELRRRNHTETHPVSGKPYSTKPILRCLEEGARLIGWQRRATPPGSQRDGPIARGIGCAVAHYPLYSEEAHARVVIDADGHVTVSSSAVDLGTGTYTFMAQVTADGLGARLEDITVAIGDSDFPAAPISGGSMTAPSVAPAVLAAAEAARQAIIEAALALPDSPFAGAAIDEMTTAGSRVVRLSDASSALSFAEVAGASGAIAGEGAWHPKTDSPFEIANFGAHFAEVAVDVETGVVTVEHFVAVHDSGRVLNPNTYRNQIYGGVIQGISAALLEETTIDRRQGRVTNANLVEYLIPTSLDVGQIEVAWLDEPDFNANPLGIKSAGEVAITGVAPAVGNAIFNATGARLRTMPFRPRRVLAALNEAEVQP